MKKSTAWRMVVLGSVMAWSAVAATAAHAETFIKMRIAGQGDFFLSETNHALFISQDGNKDIKALPYAGKDKFGNDIYVSEDKTEIFLMNSTEKNQFIYMAGIDTKTNTQNFEYKLDKRYVEEINTGK